MTLNGNFFCKPKFYLKYLGRVDAALGDGGLVALVLDLVQQRANLLELGVARLEVALLI